MLRDGKQEAVSDLRDRGLHFVNGPLPRPEWDGWFVFANVRNEILRLPYFLRFYREMGARLFVIADNGSRDGTAAYLSRQPDVLLFDAPGRYSESRFGIDWMNALLGRFGVNRWCLTVDADELLVFPHCERLSLLELTRYLDSKNEDALPSFLLDMYADAPIRHTNYEPETPFLSACPYFDAGSYSREEAEGPTRGVPSRGGPRHRLFWEGRDRDRPSPFLPKIPLVRWSGGHRYEASTHVIAKARMSEVRGALLHFKFFSDFVTRIEEEVQRREHFNEASQYSAYWEVMSSEPDLNPFFDGSVRYVDSTQLMAMNLIRSSEELDRMALRCTKQDERDVSTRVDAE